MSYVEKNKETLEQAIQQLEPTSAPAFIWDEIAAELTESAHDNLIQAAIPRLTRHEAPTVVWKQIAHSLEIESTGKVRKINRYYWIAAASVALILTTTLWFSLGSERPNYVATVEMVDKYLLDNDWESDEAIFAEVMELHDGYLRVFDDAESRDWRAELVELNDARTELIGAMDLYGKDHELIRQLSNVERDRTEVIKKMATKI
ncbi:MAG: hypothetical protein AAF242_13105 [Bacteroidota bacterium]